MYLETRSLLWTTSWTKNDGELETVIGVDDDDSFTNNCVSHDFWVLTESDVPGASLNGKQPEDLKISQLKRWLACRGAPVSGNKPDLVER